MAEPARRLWRLDEFLAFDDGTDTRYELFDGQIVAMAPASDVHGALLMRLGRQIGNALPPGCEVIGEAGIVPPERADSWYKADLAVTCAGLTGQQFVAEPILIVEVLSPSTAARSPGPASPDCLRSMRSGADGSKYGSPARSFPRDETSTTTRSVRP